MLKQPTGIAFDSKGNAYISDLGNNRIRKLDTNGIISTLAGTGGSYGWGEEGAADAHPRTPASLH